MSKDEMSAEFNDVKNNDDEKALVTYEKEDRFVEYDGGIDKQCILYKREKPVYSNDLSNMEMESLTAMCDAVIPAVDPAKTVTDDSTITFYKTSASMLGTPDHLGRIISHRLRHHVFLIRLLLFLLSTRLGTFVLGGGIRNFSFRFPFLLKFSELSLQRRQRFVQSLSRSWFSMIRMGFVGLKLLILMSFFTQVDENEKNPTWKAIGYSGPDPNITDNPSNKKNQNKAQHYQSKEDFYGPLYKVICNVNSPRETLIKSLKHRDFHVSVNVEKQISKNPAFTIHCDVVVVGSGSGGGVVAGVLAEAGYKVVVLEKGEYYARENLSLLEGQTLDQLYEASGLLATRGLEVMVMAGSTVGGGSTINWSASIRTPPHVTQEWASEHELELFDSRLFKEALDVVCKKMSVQSGISEDGFSNAVLRKGCTELGYNVVDIPRNAPSDHYCGWCCFGCKDGRKKGTCETWLKDMVDSGNGVILTGCEVERVLYERKQGRDRDTAKGVVFRFKSGDFCLVKAKVTVIACGALNTPALLKKSGLKNPNIGKNLHLHPVVMAWGYFPESYPPSNSLSEDGKVWPEKGKKSYEGGIMTAMSTDNDSKYGYVIQTPSLHPGVFGSLMPWTSGSNIKDRMKKYSRTTHLFALARDVGSGTISTDPNDIKYKLHQIDEANLKRGLEKTLRILKAAGAEEIGTHHRSGASMNVKRANEEEFEEFVRREGGREIQGLSMPVASAHQMGSCKMGVGPKTSVVSQRGESWEVERLYLADTSVFPTALGVNPMVTVQAIAYCTSLSVLESLKRI